MKNYQNYTVEDFVQDLDFRSWVLQSSQDAEAFWKDWLAQNPDKMFDIDLAKSMVKSLKINDLPVANADVERGINRILMTVRKAETVVETETKVEMPRMVPIYRRTWFAMAAAIALLVSVGLWLFTGSQNAAFTEGVVNTENAPKKVTLPDGSTVILEKNSEIHYSKNFVGTVREVQFKGEGLFDVAHNPDKPFLVKTGSVITRVLGTSFVVKSFDNQNQITVNVLRGKVSVSKADKSSTTSGASEVILVPNQKAVFSKIEEKLEQTISEKPVVIESNDTVKQQVFEETSVVDIFEALEKTYNVDIVFDKNALKNCVLSTTLTDEPLFEKLTAICKITGGTYRVVGLQVVVEGGSCQ